MKLSKIGEYQSDRMNGVRVVSPTFPGVVHYVKGEDHPDAEKLQSKLYAELSPESQANPSAEDNAIMESRILAEVLWCGVDGLEDENGKIILSKEKAFELLMSPEFGMSLRGDVRKAVRVAGRKKLSVLDDDVKN